MAKGLNYDELFPGRFMKAGLFKGKDVTLTIADVVVEALPQEKGPDRKKGIVSFEKTEMSLVLNRTNGECFKALFGMEVDTWIGKRVTLYPAEFHSTFDPEATHAIRVRGTPELAADKVIEIRLARKKPFKVTMKATGRGQRAAVQVTPPTEPEETARDVDEPAADQATAPVTEPAKTQRATAVAKPAAAVAEKSEAKPAVEKPAPAKRAPAFDVPF